VYVQAMDEVWSCDDGAEIVWRLKNVPNTAGE